MDPDFKIYQTRLQSTLTYLASWSEITKGGGGSMANSTPPKPDLSPLPPARFPSAIEAMTLLPKVAVAIAAAQKRLAHPEPTTVTDKVITGPKSLDNPPIEPTSHSPVDSSSTESKATAVVPEPVMSPSTTVAPTNPTAAPVPLQLPSKGIPAAGNQDHGPTIQLSQSQEPPQPPPQQQQHQHQPVLNANQIYQSTHEAPQTVEQADPTPPMTLGTSSVPPVSPAQQGLDDVQPHSTGINPAPQMQQIAQVVTSVSSPGTRVDMSSVSVSSGIEIDQIGGKIPSTSIQSGENLISSKPHEPAPTPSITSITNTSSPMHQNRTGAASLPGSPVVAQFPVQTSPAPASVGISTNLQTSAVPRVGTPPNTSVSQIPGSVATGLTFERCKQSFAQSRYNSNEFSHTSGVTSDGDDSSKTSVTRNGFPRIDDDTAASSHAIAATYTCEWRPTHEPDGIEPISEPTDGPAYGLEYDPIGSNCADGNTKFDA
ncbi:hypothetical protein BGZ79_008745 [Entomortierella chlamydospora]|nr:hypothetical protein BGZ79_008745 [Entomortierella chlamydospora]